MQNHIEISLNRRQILGLKPYFLDTSLATVLTFRTTFDQVKIFVLIGSVD